MTASGSNLLAVAIVAAGYTTLLASSGLLTKTILSRVAGQPIGQTVNSRTLDEGFIIGKCENILLLTFTLLEAYTAISLIFTAKAIVRREDMSRNSLFFLAGTMINVSYSIVVGLVVKLALTVLHGGQLFMAGKV
ncbi:MAG: hypothetical protein V2A77_05360 [Pseudomonadota bacterium]